VGVPFDLVFLVPFLLGGSVDDLVVLVLELVGLLLNIEKPLDVVVAESSSQSLQSLKIVQP
jgi:hypothetical protein